jgi:hypothetical protein
MLFHTPGIVPLFCEEMFQGIDKKKAEGGGTEYEVKQTYAARYIYLSISKSYTISNIYLYAINYNTMAETRK